MTDPNAVVRVRFAPSPTGHLHVGGARTALYNYLYARKNGGVFVLRIEDTDARRSTRESYEGILRGMRWLGLDWDEGPDAGGDYGPYIQSARSLLYHTEAKKLLDKGRAYHCFCSTEELEAMKASDGADERVFRYDGRCRRLAQADVDARLEDGQPHVIRFMMPEKGSVHFRDIVRGEFTFENAELDDFVLIKSDGKPTYNFAVVVDDSYMKITHVIRGDDHISNTPRQIHLYQAMGASLPKFAHLPMILGRDKTRLSKRHGATSIDFYREKRYLPDAMVNYLALLGWSFDGKRELFTRKKLINSFSLKKISRNPAMFDTGKMEWINGEHFKTLNLVQRAALVYGVLEDEGYLPPDFEVDMTRPVNLKLVPGKEPLNEKSLEAGDDFNPKEYKRLVLLLRILGNRLKLLKDIPSMMGYFFKDDFYRDEVAVRTHLMRPEIPERMVSLADEYERLRYFDREAVEETLRALADKMGLEAGELIHPCRVALTGTTVSPDIFWVIMLLGREKTVERLRTAAQLVKRP